MSKEGSSPALLEPKLTLVLYPSRGHAFTLRSGLRRTAFYFFEGHEVFWTGWLSRALFIYALAMTAWLIFENKRLAQAA